MSGLLCRAGAVRAVEVWAALSPCACRPPHSETRPRALLMALLSPAAPARDLVIAGGAGPCLRLLEVEEGVLAEVVANGCARWAARGARGGAWGRG